jgi:uncharacterized protein YjlB
MDASERAARNRLGAERLSSRSWSNGPGDHYTVHTHAYRKVLVCRAGSIIFHTPDGDLAVAAGDRIELPAGTPHSATVGPEGVRCVEVAHP